MVTALYRRYRPEAFAEMIGQSQVTDPLMTALRTGRIGHAYLFSGPRGCGKTTSARILARCLNCAEGPTDTPCGSCESCVELSRDGGGSLDVVEIDAASHGGVDDARDLRERAVFAPARDRFKIFIIDEAHMVTAGGFNALLKIVEEPPPHVKFVFATTEPDKVIGTIRSRTHHYPFRLIAPATLIEYVQSLCESEGIEVEAGVLALVVRAGGGSVRDTLSILDQLIAGSEGGVITADRAAGLLGFTHSELLDDVVVALGARDAAAAFRATNRVVQTGQDPRRFVEDLLERLRDLIVVSATSVQGASAVLRGVPEDRLQRMFEQAQTFGRAELSGVADTVSEALDKMMGATAPRLQLELMMARALVHLGGEVRSGDESLGIEPARAEPMRTAHAGAGAGSASTGTASVGPSSAGLSSAGQTGAATAPVTAEPALPAPQASENSSTADESASSGEPTKHAGQGPDPTSLAASAERAQPEMNAAEAARAARDFLRNDSAGAAPFGRPVTDVLGMMKENEASAPASPAPVSPASAPSAPSPSPQAAESPTPAPSTSSPQASSSPPAAAPARAATAEDLGIDELREMWPDLLDEILENDRNAWNAVRAVQPFDFNGEILWVGYHSDSDLAVFKSDGAGALREAILAATGVHVKYLSKSLPSSPETQMTGQDRGVREGSTPPSGDAGTSPEPDDPEPAQPPQPASQTPDDDPVLRAAEARLAALRPRSQAAAPAAPEPDGEHHTAAETQSAPVPDTRPDTPDQGLAQGSDDPDYFAPSDQPDSYPDDPDPYAEAPAPASSEALQSTPPSAEPVPVPEKRAEPEARTQRTEKKAPEFVRYGEAVVREVLNARFIEERPLPGTRES